MQSFPIPEKIAKNKTYMAILTIISILIILLAYLIALSD